MPSDPPPLLCALLRGESPAWPDDAGDEAAVAFLDEARYHGVTPLVDARFRGSGSASDATSGRVREGAAGPASARDPALASWPAAVRDACHDDAIVHSVVDLRRRTELARVLAALAGEGIGALILKGTALAYSRYADPALRPRADTDLLVAPKDRDGAMLTLRELGYRRVSGPAAAYVGYQAEMTRTDARGASATIDLHWRWSNAQSFAWLVGFDELSAGSVPVEALGPHARRPGDVHALLHAIIHRAGNNVFVAPGYGDRLIWLHDFRVLADAMDDADRRRFVQRVADLRIGAAALEGLRRCASCFPSPRLDSLVEALARDGAASSGEALLRAGRLRREWSEFAAIPTMRARLGWIAGRILPGADYMRERYPDAAGRPLPALHARRWLDGVARREPKPR